MVNLTHRKKILIALSDSLLAELDECAKSQHINRSELVREAMKFYIKEKKKYRLMEELKNGYIEMAGINLEIADSWQSAENEALKCYEEKLSECE